RSTLRPAAGRWGRYRWMYIWDCSRSVGAGRAITRKTRGLTRSVMALIVPPLPAPSRPSNTMQTFSPSCRTHSCSFTSSTWSFLSSGSYSLPFSPVPPGDPPSLPPSPRGPISCSFPDHAAEHRHADAVGQALPQRAGRGLDARGPAVLRVTRASAVPLAEGLDRLERDRGLAQPLVVLADRPDARQVQ